MYKSISVDIENLDNFIKKEINDFTFNRFPLRLILIDDFDVWKECVYKFRSYVDSVFKISDYIKSEDSYPDIYQFLLDIKEAAKNGYKVLCIPVSEVIEITNDLNLIRDLASFEINPIKNGRIYFLLKSNKKIDKFLESLHDIGIRKALPVQIRSRRFSSSKGLFFYFFTDKKIYRLLNNFNDFKVIRGIKNYLKIWEDLNFSDGDRFLVYSSVIFNSVEESEGFVSFKKIVDIKELLEKYFECFIFVEYNEEERKFWEKLLIEIIENKVKDFLNYLCIKFNVRFFDSSLFSRWTSLNFYEKWLLFNWAKREFLEEISYLTKVIKKSNSLEQFEELIWNHLLEEKEINLEDLKERIEIIKKLKIDPPKYFYQRLDELNPLVKLKLLPGLNDYEKKEIIYALNLCIKKGIRQEDLIKILEINYPELAFYLTFPIQELKFYFEKYINAKILNSDSELNFLINYAKNFNLFSYPSRNSILEKYTCPRVWVDGLGIEWIGLIYRLLSKEGYYVNIEFGRANLPTTTEFNYIPDHIDRFADLDEIYHRQDRDYPEYLVEEIEKIVRLLKEKIKPLINKYGEILITSDHGSTRFAGWVNEKIDVNNMETFYNGRYAIWISKKEPELHEDYYIENYGGSYYLISKTHKNFKNGKRTKIENHGGGTPEEVIVPILHLSTQQLPENVNFKILNNEISFLNPIIEIQTNIEVKNLKLFIFGLFIEGKSKSKLKWEFDLRFLRSKLKPGKYKFKIISEKGEKNEELIIKGGLEEEILFGEE